MGGAMGAHDDEKAPWLPAVRDLIRTAAAARVPTLGICLGHQLCAVALGGEIVVNPQGRQLGLLDVGWTAAAVDDELMGGLRRPAPGDALERRRGDRSPRGRRPSRDGEHRRGAGRAPCADRVGHPVAPGGGRRAGRRLGQRGRALPRRRRSACSTTSSGRAATSTSGGDRWPSASSSSPARRDQRRRARAAPSVVRRWPRTTTRSRSRTSGAASIRSSPSRAAPTTGGVRTTRGSASGAAAEQPASISSISCGCPAVSTPPPSTTGMGSPRTPRRRMAATARATTSSA